MEQSLTQVYSRGAGKTQGCLMRAMREKRGAKSLNAARVKCQMSRSTKQFRPFRVTLMLSIHSSRLIWSLKILYWF
ncbi:hypothetical protein FGO68_gene7596 [Halteria grandinella]|uniref:Uncharacterized protein n=1 Tax=Halteria grandinella TaxID=5974 RepID=A0A8J8NKH2_HALGN|nr:hypothetical protein FGO68_gene7596 [Halteria grandinella]